MDPCGLMMDGLPATVTGDSMRCYITTMRLRENPELLATVRWYRCPPGAKPFPGPHCFGSTFWDPTRPERPLVGLGEVQRKGTPDRGVAPLGVCGCDTPTPLEWFRSGVPANVQLPYSAGPCPSDGEAFTLCLCGPEISFEEGEAFMRLEDLTDVAVTNVQDGDMIAYSASAGEWLNVPPPAGGVVSFNGRVGAVSLTSSDVVNALGGAPALLNAANTFTVGGHIIEPQTDATKGLSIQRHSANQTANLYETLDESGNPCFAVDGLGNVTVGPYGLSGHVIIRAYGNVATYIDFCNDTNQYRIAGGPSSATLYCWINAKVWEATSNAFYVYKRSFLAAPNTAPNDADLLPGQWSSYLDEAGNNLVIRVLYSDGTTYKTATIPLV